MIANEKELSVPTTGLVDELGTELRTTLLRDKTLGIKESGILWGVSWGPGHAMQWRFLEEGLNYIEVGSVYHGEFIARVAEIYTCVTCLALIAWRPAFGKSQEYIRFARLSRKPFKPIQLQSGIGPYLGMKLGDLVEFVAKITFCLGDVKFEIPITRLKVLQYKSQEEVERRAS